MLWDPWQRVGTVQTPWLERVLGGSGKAGEQGAHGAWLQHGSSAPGQGQGTPWPPLGGDQGLWAGLILLRTASSEGGRHCSHVPLAVLCCGAMMPTRAVASAGAGTAPSRRSRTA